MAIKAVQVQSFAELGDAWMRDQSARILQRHLQSDKTAV